MMWRPMREGGSGWERRAARAGRAVLSHPFKTALRARMRQAANKAMAGIGQGFVDLGAMEKLLATPPVLADDTVYTALIWPSGSVYQSTVRTHLSLIHI